MPYPLRVVLVEDDENKRSQIMGALRELSEVGEVRDARSYKSGLRALLAGDLYDLVLLDMTLPTFDVGPEEPGGETQLYAGRDLLRQIQRRSIESPVVVVTQYTAFGEGEERVTLEELDAELRYRHPSQYLGHVYYDAVREEWRRRLIDFVKGVARQSSDAPLNNE